MSNIKNLDIIRKTLKSEFIGVDKQIDKIINLITPWYIDPDLLDRPIVINLWGMTGSGKTSIVRRLVDLLDTTTSFCEIDLGKYTSDEGSNDVIFRQAAKLANKKAVFLIDEVQTARTLAGSTEIDRPALRDLWSFLNDGKVIYPVYGDYVLDDLFSTFLDTPDEDLTLEKLDKYMVHEIMSRFRVNIKDRKFDKARTLKGKEFIKFLLDVLGEEALQKTENFSKSLVFLAGNLDEAFLGSHSVDYEMVTADELYKMTLKINSTDIKEALLKRFRAEQVSRLGSNHVIFHSLPMKHYRGIMESYIRKTKSKVNSKYKVSMNFTPTLKGFILEEGVVASQGVRTIQSTYSSLIDSKIPYLITYAKSHKATKITMDYDKLKHEFLINFQKGNKIVYRMKDSVMFEMNKQRSELHKEPMRSYVAIHEAAHAVVGYLAKEQYPTMIRSKVSSNEYGGLVKFEETLVNTKKTILADIVTTLAGHAAEKLAFGSDNVSIFAQSDLKMVTKDASDMIRQYGMGSHLGISLNDESSPQNTTSSQESDDKMIESILQDCYNKACDLLIMNSEFHEEVAEVLRNHSHLDSKEFKHIAKKYFGGKNNVTKKST